MTFILLGILISTSFQTIKRLNTGGRYGQKQGRHPNFDSLLASHKITIEKLPKDFDWSFYCNNYLDLQQAGISNRFKAVHHYLKYGHQEGRICSPYSDFQKKHLGDFPETNHQAIDTIVNEIHGNPRERSLDDYLTTKMHEFWLAKETQLTELAKLDTNQTVATRQQLLSETGAAVEFMAESYRKAFLSLSDALKIKINPRRVLIVGDFFLPQCIRYRIEQKLEQLSFAVYEASAVSWTLPEKIFQELAFHDVIIFYRTPALPEIVRAIIHARALGKLTFYEIDDLLFEPIYPPPIQSYGSYVSPDSYAGLLKGMALYNNAAKLCEFGIASTQPLVERLSKYVESGMCFLHRNGSDSQNSYSNHRLPDKTNVDIFYGSGTQAHNSDFIDIALPALTVILQKHSHVRLIIVGYLELPTEFCEKFSQQLVQIPIVKSLPSYWSLLSNADINIAVLNRDDINDCKSELKWFEAACFRIPSIVSKTTNYEDVIKQDFDGIMVENTEEWIAAFDHLITDSDKRTKIGTYAFSRVRRDYAIEKLSANLETIIQSAISSKLH